MLKKLLAMAAASVMMLSCFGAVASAANETMVDDFTDLSKIYENAGGYGVSMTIAPWTTGCIVASNTNQRLEITYLVDGIIDNFSVDAYYTSYDTSGDLTADKYVDNLVFKASADGSTWEDVTATLITGTAFKGYSNRATKLNTFTSESLSKKYKYLKVMYPESCLVSSGIDIDGDGKNGWSARWLLVLDKVTINYKDVYAFTDTFSTPSDFSTLYDSSWRCNFGANDNSVDKSLNPIVHLNNDNWNLADGWALIPLNVGSIPHITYKFDNDIQSFAVETVYATYNSMWATDFIFEVSASGEDNTWVTLVKDENLTKTRTYSGSGREVYKWECYNIPNNSKYLKITFGDNTLVDRRWAVALDTVKVTCELGDTTLSMADGESGTIYCSTSSDNKKSSATLVPTSDVAKSATAILATYGSNNKLVNVQTKAFAFNTTADLSCTRLNLPTSNSVKLMIIDSLGNLKPITAVTPLD